MNEEATQSVETKTETVEAKQVSINDEIERLTGTEKPKVVVNKVKSDDKKNLVDDKGDVVAKSGAERRLFNKFKQENDTLKNEIETFRKEKENIVKFLPEYQKEFNELKAENESYKEIKSMCDSGEIKKEDLLVGARLVKEYASDPVKTVKMLLTDLENRGYDINDDSINDKKKIEELVNEKLKPFEEEREKKIQEEQKKEYFAKQVQEFYGKYEHSETHSKEIVQLGKKMGGDFVGAYYQLREFYLKRGLDFSKPYEKQNIKKDNKISGLPNKNISSVRPRSDEFTSSNSINSKHRDIIKQLME